MSNMKNIYILPTDKPSRLYLFKGRLILGDLVTVVFKNSGAINQHIYITSDEEIKVGDWCLGMDGIFQYKGKINIPDIELPKKIILTTDQDLIKDGIQAIDDEFLEWFVKNPSCEEVEVKKGKLKFNDDGEEYGFPDMSLYKIIIPKEEPKQIYYNTVGIENGVNVVKGQFNTQKEALDLANELNRKFPDLYYDWRETLIKEEPKQETLEEASERYWVKQPYNEDAFIEGANWQAKRMYSEEEVFTMCRAFATFVQRNAPSYKKQQEWFEQFKKK